MSKTITKGECVMISNSTQLNQGRFHYAFLIVAACICLCAACSLMVNCAGVYLTSVSLYFNASSAEFMLYFTILQLTMVVALPIAGKIMNYVDLRVLFTVSALLCAAGNVILALSPALWMFYIGSVFMGAGTAPLLFLAVPKLIGAWCAKRVGFFTGLSLAFTGIGGVVFNPIQAVFIDGGPEGWRTAYLVAAAILLVLTLPFTIFVIRNTPADKGMLPYGAESGGAEKAQKVALNSGIKASKAMKTSAFFAIAAFGGLIALNQTVYQFLPAYAQSFSASLPEIAALSATIASVCMAGLSIGKIALGFVNDRSSRGGVTLCIGCGVVGVLLMWLCPTLAPALLLGSFLFGFVYAATTVQTTLLARSVFGNLDYATIYSRVSVVSSLGGAFAATVWGVVIDMPNGFSIMFVLSIGIMILAFACAMFSLSQAPKYANQHEG